MKKPQCDDGGAQSRWNQAPHLPGGRLTNWRTIPSKVFSHCSESSGPHNWLPNLRFSLFTYYSKFYFYIFLNTKHVFYWADFVSISCLSYLCTWLVYRDCRHLKVTICSVGRFPSHTPGPLSCKHRTAPRPGSADPDLHMPSPLKRENAGDAQMALIILE